MKKTLLIGFLLSLTCLLKANEIQFSVVLNRAGKLSAVSKSNEALNLLWDGLRQAESKKNVKYVGLFSLALADEYLYINQIDSIDFYYGEALKIFESLGLENELIRAKLGLLELPRRTNPSSTMDKYLELLKQARAINDNATYYLILEKIIMVNNGMENYTEAFAQTHECINYYQAVKDTFHLAIKYRELGALFFTHFAARNGPAYEKDSCFYYHEKAIKLSYQINAFRNLVFAYQRLSWLLYKTDLNLAWKYIKTADSIDKLYNIKSPQLPNIMSFSLFKMGRVKEAIQKSKEALDMGLKAKQLFIGIQATDQLCIYYKAIKRYDSALYYNEMSHMFNDSVRSQKHYKDAAKMQAKLEFDKEAYEKELIQKEEIKRQSVIQKFTFSTIILLLVIIGLVYRAFLNYKKSASIIKAQNDEKTILIKEIHHRVKNNLSVISGILDLQKRNIKDEQMLEVFKDAKSRINSMALVHKNLYEQDDFSTINAQSYFENLYITVSSAYKLQGKNIVYNIQCKNVNINIDTLIPLALITNELLTNSFKYAFDGKEKGRIQLSLNNTERGFEMQYSDDGIGYNFEELKPNKEGLGTLLINGLIKQLDGSVKKESTSNGLAYILSFKGIHA